MPVSAPRPVCLDPRCWALIYLAHPALLTALSIHTTSTSPSIVDILPPPHPPPTPHFHFLHPLLPYR